MITHILEKGSKEGLLYSDFVLLQYEVSQLHSVHAHLPHATCYMLLCIH